MLDEAFDDAVIARLEFFDGRLSFGSSASSWQYDALSVLVGARQERDDNVRERPPMQLMIVNPGATR